MGDPMKARKSGAYAVELGEDSAYREMMMVLLAVLFAWSVLSFLMIEGTGRGSALMRGLNAAVVILVGVLLYKQVTRPRRSGKRLLVRGDTFQLEGAGDRDRIYRFDEVTRVRQRVALNPNGRGGLVAGAPYWQVFVGEQCVVSFYAKGENALRFLGELDKRGLITPYGTGIKS